MNKPKTVEELNARVEAAIKPLLGSADDWLQVSTHLHDWQKELAPWIDITVDGIIHGTEGGVRELAEKIREILAAVPGIRLSNMSNGNYKAVEGKKGTFFMLTLYAEGKAADMLSA